MVKVWKYLFTVTIGLFGDEGFPVDGKEESHAIAIAQHDGSWWAACSHHPQPRPYTGEMQGEWTSMTIYCLYQDDSLPDGRTPLSTGMTYEIWQEKDVPSILREEPSRCPSVGVAARSQPPGGGSVLSDTRD